MKSLKPALTRLAQVSPTILAAGTLGCALLRLTVRDRWPVFSMIFYASPPVLMAGVLMVAAGAWAVRREWRPAIGAGGGALVAVAWWFATSLVLAPPPDGDRPKDLLRGMGWNVARGAYGWDGVLEGIRNVDPDVAWFGEAEDPAWKGGPPWHAGLQGYDRREMGGGLVLVTKGRIREARQLMDGRNSLAEFRITVRGADLTVLLVDLDGSPWRHRGPALSVVQDAIESAPPGPLLVGGDFNTPRDSALLDGWRPRLTHAFEAVGRGMDGTWPEPLPFLSIDHCWVNDRVKVWKCELGRTGASDHRPVILEFRPGE